MRMKKWQFTALIVCVLFACGVGFTYFITHNQSSNADGKEIILNQDVIENDESNVIEEDIEHPETTLQPSETPEISATPEVTSTPEPTPVPTPTPEVSYGGWHQSEAATTVFNKINEVRVNNGLSELPWNDGDTWLADIRSEELVNEVATNTVHAGIKNYDRYVGEIAACGYGPNEVVDAWMQSSGHANQILADYNTSMAVGVYYDEYTATSYYIVIFR